MTSHFDIHRYKTSKCKPKIKKKYMFHQTLNTYNDLIYSVLSPGKKKQSLVTIQKQDTNGIQRSAEK